MIEIYKLTNGVYTCNPNMKHSNDVVETLECEAECICLGIWGNKNQCVVLKNSEGKLGFLFLWYDNYYSRKGPFTDFDKVQIYTTLDCGNNMYAYAIAYKGNDWEILMLSDQLEEGFIEMPIDHGFESDISPISCIPEEFLKGPSICPFVHTPDKITKLEKNEIFVFGSNKEGDHLGGAAAAAAQLFGAQWGVGVGRTGQCYAIPTMDKSLELIAEYVEGFRCYAVCHPELTFYVTPIGCGIAKWTKEQIAPLFAFAHNMANVILPKGW